MKILMSMILALALFACDNEVEAQGPLPASELTIQSADGITHNFTIELALTPQQQAIGLMNRTSMPADHGMLFFFGEESERGFWMKNTLIPLDMIFIKKDGTIHHIHDSAQPNDLTSVSSNGPVQAVLELNGGMSKKIGIQAGDKVRHILFSAP